MLKIFYTDTFPIPLPEKHRFPIDKYPLLRDKISTGATIDACRTAIAEGFAVNLGGGTHHGFHDRGHDFCWLNDSAIAARAMQAESLAETILIVDCDVHQGNGAAAILKHDPSIFTFELSRRCLNCAGKRRFAAADGSGMPWLFRAPPDTSDGRLEKPCLTIFNPPMRG